MEKLLIVQGSTLLQPVRWATDPYIYKPITAVTSVAPLRLTVPAHQLPQGWRIELMSMQGLTQLNSSGKNLASDFHYATVIDANTIELNAVNASDYAPYVSGGYIRYYTPVPLSGYTADLTIWNKIDGDVLLNMTTGNGQIEIDVAKYSINLRLTAAQTAALTFKKGVFGLDTIHTATGVVTKIASGPVVVEIE